MTEATTTTEMQVRQKFDCPVGIRSCNGSRLYSLCVLHYVEGVSTKNLLDAVLPRVSENSFVKTLPNKDRELTQIKSSSTKCETEEGVSCLMTSPQRPAVPEELHPVSIQLPLNDEALNYQRECSRVPDVVDRDIGGLFNRLNSWSTRINEEENHSGVLTEETGDLRTHLDRLWNELMDTKAMLNRDFLVEEVHASGANNCSNSGYTVGALGAFEVSSALTELSQSSQDFTHEANALIEQLAHVELCYSTGGESYEFFTDGEDVEVDQESCASSSFFCHSEISSRIDELIEESAEENEQSIELPIEQIDKSMEPKFEALLSAYDIASLMDDFITKEDESQMKTDPVRLNSAMSIYNEKQDEKSLKSELQDTVNLEHGDSSTLCDDESVNLTDQEDSTEVHIEESEEIVEVQDLPSLEPERNLSISPSLRDWAVYCPDVFHEENAVNDDELVEVYQQEMKEVAVNTKRVWFFFKEKRRLWPKFPRRTKNWFQKLFTKFRVFPNRSKEEEASHE
eukprot:g8292.t1